VCVYVCERERDRGHVCERVCVCVCVCARRSVNQRNPKSLALTL